MPPLAPIKLTDDLTRTFATLVRAGNTVAVACNVVGIDESTYYDWMRRAKRKGDANDPYRAFRAALEQARGEAEAILVGQITTSARNGSWQAAAWLLERRWPERWAKPDQRKESDKPPANPFDALDELAKKRAAKG
jgi:hypothetical protein